MKRKLPYLALVPFYALLIAAGIHAGGPSHEGCAECNRAIGKKITTLIQAHSGEKIYVLEDSLKGNRLAGNSTSAEIRCSQARTR